MTFDTQKAREDLEMHENAIEEAQSCMCGHCHECGFDPAEMKGALDEIERLQDREQQLKLDCGILWQSKMLLAARIKELEAARRGPTADQREALEHILQQCRDYAPENRVIMRLALNALRDLLSETSAQARTIPQRRALALAAEAIQFHRKAREDLEQYNRMDEADRKTVLDRIFGGIEEIDGEREAEQIILDMATGAGER